MAEYMSLYSRPVARLFRLTLWIYVHYEMIVSVFPPNMVFTVCAASSSHARGRPEGKLVYPRRRILNRKEPSLIRQKTGYNNRSLSLKKYLSLSQRRAHSQSLLVADPKGGREGIEKDRERERVSSLKLRRPGTLSKRV